MHEFEIELGGKTYPVKPLPIRPARELRQKIGTALDEPLRVIKGLNKTEITDTEVLSDIVFVLKDALIGYVDIALEVVCDYARLDTEQREWIEENALDEEVIAAFAEVAKRLFPFEALMPMISSALNAGSKARTISKS